MTCCGGAVGGLGSGFVEWGLQCVCVWTLQQKEIDIANSEAFGPGFKFKLQPFSAASMPEQGKPF